MCWSNDSIADDCIMKHRLEILNSFNIPTEFHCYPGLYHRFGLEK